MWKDEHAYTNREYGMSDQEAVDNSVLFKALDDDPEAIEFRELWMLWASGNKQRTLVDGYYSGKSLITRARYQECEEALMQLKQLENILIRLAAPLKGASRRAAQIIIQTAVRQQAESRQKLKDISGWIS
ncbi:hypothetical protein BOO94_04100 [Pseudomonas sp. FSL W5-0299]|nr:hypothetical protein BOO94_04100 [Pseudomonas sp. FSL W5-0299]